MRHIFNRESRRPQGMIAAGRRFSFAIAGLVVLAGCGERVHSISAVPGDVRLRKVGATLQIEAEARTRAGAKTKGVILSYRSREPTVAQVSSSGLVTAAGDGTTTIVVQAEGSDAVGFVRVVVRLPAEVDVRPASTTCHIGNIKQLKAKTLDRRGKAFPSVSYVWTSSDETVARVDDGEVVGLKEGRVTITAAALGITGSSDVNVVWAPGQQAQVEAERRGKKRRASRGRGGGGGQQERGKNWDPRLNLFD